MKSDTKEVLRLIRARRRDWINERRQRIPTGRPDFFNGVLRGFHECIAIAKKAGKI